MSEKNILYKEVLNAERSKKNRNIGIETAKRTIKAKFEDCDEIGVMVILREDEQPVIENYRKRKIKTFIPWSRIKEIRI